MEIIEVRDKKTEKKFLDVARIIYKDDKFWVCPLDSQINSIFNPNQNIFFKNGEAIRWIMKDDKGNLIGRVAAFINKKKAYNFDQPTGGMGFFECVNDKTLAFMLFDRCKEWLQKRGMQAMDGPINFGENHIFWGLLVEGFTHPGVGMQYNHLYYKDFFEDYGFKFYFEQITNHLDLKKKFPERFWKIAEWIANKPEFEFKHLNLKKTDEFIDDLKKIYDEAWKFYENFVPINKEDLKEMVNELNSIIEEEFIWFAYHNNQPIAFFIMFPDVNQILKHFNGKMNLCNKLKFLYLKHKKTITRARIVIMGVVPKYQKSGIESAIFWNLDKKMKKRPEYTELELSWVGDFNPKMRQLHQSVGAIFAKRHITYRKLFKDDAKYHRSTIIPMDTREKYLKN